MAGKPFAGTQRFQVLSRLGAGGMGAVYHVIDRENGTRMALKTVGVVDGDALLRFKREFRALQDLDHPNIISFGELFESDGEWYYTMELLDGTDVLEHVRTARELGEGGADALHTPTDPGARRPSPEPDVDLPTTVGRLSTDHVVRRDLGFDEARLRSCLAQLASGLSALHRAGKVHRDIKPSNLMVTPEGRLVILDFGLVVDLEDGTQRSDVGVMGTYAFMAPEQASGLPVDGRADWYGVGVVLFQALTGRLPFRGKALTALTAKLYEEAPEPRALVAGVPSDLNDLCRDLLQRDPAARPSPREIFRRLHIDFEDDAYASHVSTHSSSVVGENPFMGRDDELAILEAAFDAVRAGEAQSLVICGQSGIGKSELVTQFLKRIGREDTLILRGRCYEREAVRYKSFDGVIDELSGELVELEDEVVRRLVPHHAELLSRAFPVLKRVERFTDPHASHDVRDPHEQRARVFAALRTLFARLAERKRVVILIEDLQWLDADTRSLLRELLREPAAPCMLFVGTLRTTLEADAATRELQHILRDLPVATLSLGPLAEEAAVALAEKLLQGRGDMEQSHAAEIARETGGHPLFIDELARHVELREEAADHRPQLDEAILNRVHALEPTDQRLLRVLTVSGRPMARDVLGHACQIDGEEAFRRCSALRILRLLRMNGVRKRDTVEAYHGRIIEALDTEIDPAQRREVHERIVRALEATGDADPLDLATHWAGAGEPRRAAGYAAEGAQAAEATLAFDRAADLYRLALSLAPEGPDNAHWRRRLAHALANAGRGGAAGIAYLDAVSGSPAAVAIDLRRRAAEQFLISGHVEKGIATFREVLRDLGIRLPRMLLEVFLSIAWVRLRLLFRGMRFKERDESMVQPEERLRVDTCHSVGVGLAPTDPFRAVDFYGRTMLRALRLGEPGRIAGMLAIEAVQRVVAGRRGQKKAFAMLQQARQLAERTQNPYSRAAVAYGEGMSAYLVGDWSAALDAYARAETIYREECPDQPAEFRTVQACTVHCLWELGRWAELQHRVGRAVKEAEERGDLFTGATTRAGLNMQAMAMRDRPVEGRAGADATMTGWQAETFDVQQYMYLVHGCLTDVYQGKVDEAFRRFEEGFVWARFSLLFQVQLMRAGIHFARGLVALARAAKDASVRPAMLRIVRRSARRLAREDVLWAQANGRLLIACADALRGEVSSAQVDLELAAHELDRAGMQGRAHAARWALGALLGGDRGHELVDAARHWMRSQGVRDPDAFAPTLAPLLYAVDVLAIPPSPGSADSGGLVSSHPPRGPSA